nr:MarR family transcriptional regulator [uncultured Vibrio sp.]
MDNDRYLDTLGLVDLISEKHKQFRQETMQRIGRHFELTFSEMDIYLISLVQFNAMSVSESARYMNISRQAAHKHVKNLESLNLVELTTSASNRREKIITLTQSGKQFGEQVIQIKNELEMELEEKLGVENYRQVKALFKETW